MSRRPPKISVIVPVYNDQEGIERLLASLANQSYPQEHFEVLVVDNESSPAITMPDSHPRDTQLLVSNDKGSYAARNVGILASTGEILAFTDADCWCDENWLKAGVRAVSEEGDRIFAGGEIILETGTSPNAVELYQMLVGFMQAENIRDRNFTATANLFCFKSQFELAGLFNAELLSGGDRMWCWHCVSLDYRAVFASEAIISTRPRASLRAAITQARRVAGGRHHLLGKKTLGGNAGKLKPPRTALDSIKWIFAQDHITFGQRLRVFLVASILKLASVNELVWLRLGKTAERR